MILPIFAIKDLAHRTLVDYLTNALDNFLLPPFVYAPCTGLPLPLQLGQVTSQTNNRSGFSFLVLLTIVST